MQNGSSPKVSLIMGSVSDMDVMKKAKEILDEFSVESEVQVVSAHRTPEMMYEYAKNARNRSIKIIIAGAGGAAHLPGMVASLTTLPVIGVPVKSASLNGIDSLLSIVQMPKAVPVATMAINGAENAALLAIRILALDDLNLLEKLEAYSAKISEDVYKSSEELYAVNYK